MAAPVESQAPLHIGVMEGATPEMMEALRLRYK